MIPKINPKSLHIDIIRDKYILQTIKRHRNAKAMIDEVKKYLKLYPEIRFTIDDVDSEDSVKNQICMKIMENEQLDSSNPAHAEYLLYTSLFFPDPFFRQKLQEQSLDTLLQQDFETGYAILTKQEIQFNLYSVNPILTFIEKKVINHDHFEKMKDKMHSFLAYTEDNTSLDKLAYAEQITDKLLDKNKCSTVLEAMLETRVSDRRIKELIYKINRADYTRISISSLFQTSMSHKYATLRNLLTSKNGLLQSKKGISELHELLLSKILSPPISDYDRQWYEQIDIVTKNFMHNAGLEDSYFILVPLMIDKILLPPEKTTPLIEIIKSVTCKERILSYCTKYSHLIERAIHGEDVRKDLTIYIANNQSLYIEGYCYNRYEDYEDTEENDYLGRKIGPLNEENTKFVYSHKSIEKIIAELKVELDFASEFDNFYIEVKEIEDSIKEKTREIKSESKQSGLVTRIIKKDESPLAGSLSPLEFIVTGAKNLGAPGVRFLQLLGQYIDIPEEYQYEFNKVYDGVKGQSKLAAYLLIEREWPEFKEEIKLLLPSIGGGSLMTVYEAIRYDGQREAIKVLNPNTEYHTDKSFSVIKNIIAMQASTDPRYEIAIPLIEDIYQWIKADIGFQGFLEKDKQFYAQNNGFRSNKYRIKVPRSYGDENKYYKREEFIQGVNVTHLDELKAKGHNTKAIVSIIAKNYISQIENGLIHSDIHPGNFRVTDNNEVSILDRNFFLELDNQDKMLLFTLQKRFIPAKIKVAAVTDYISRYNPELPHYFNQAMSDSLAKNKNEYQLGDLVHTLREMKLSVPLKMTLLIKNFYALQSMSYSVGFDSLIDAIKYKE
jgi:predicted unusual protein kinase regulating ubiquinone biosynthesis (AarF/ABC1/UbiB family)